MELGRWLGAFPAARVLALLCLGSAAVCAVSALHPLNDHVSVPFNAVMAVVGTLLAALLLAARASLTPRHLLTGGLVYTCLVLLLLPATWAPGTVLILTVNLFCTAAFFACFFSRRTALAHGLFAGVGLVLLTPLGHVEQMTFATIVAAVAMLAFTLVFAYLVDALRVGATRDPLTGLYNRAGFEDLATRELANAHRADRPLTLAVIDLDGFKAVNDRDGHSAGDALLVSLASTWRDLLRKGDALARWGGDEFTLLLPGSSPADAEEVLARMRASQPATWSAGLASWRPGDTLQDLLQRADAELYAAKAR